MIPMLAWFIFILLIALLAFLAIKFLALRIVLALLLTIPILISFSFIVLRRSPVLTSNKNEFFASFHVASEGGNGQFNTINAFKQIKSHGGDTVKMDVRLTKDGMLILYREPTVDDDTLVYQVEETHWVQMSKLKPYGGNTLILTFDEAVTWCEKNEIKMLWHLPAFQSDLSTYLRNKILQDDLYSKVAVTTYSSVTALKLRLADTKLLIGLIWGSTEHSIKNGTAAGTALTQWMFSAMDSFGYWGMRSLLIPQFLGIDFLVTGVSDADSEMITELKSYNINTVISGITTQNEKAFFVNQLDLPILSQDIDLFSNSRGNTTRKNSINNKN